MLPMLADHKAFSYIVYLLYIMAVKHEEVGVTEQTEATTQTDEKCSFSNQLSNDARAIARIDNKSFCQINQEALAYYVNKRKIRDDCKNNLISGPDCKCAES
jgi:sorbitol-specific phosphotransferase system component IIBC